VATKPSPEECLACTASGDSKYEMMRREPVNLDGNSHSGKKIHHSIIYLHLDAIERDTGRIDAIDAVAVVARDARKLTNTLAASLPSIPAGPEHGLVHRLYFN